MSSFYDDLERRSEDERQDELSKELPKLIRVAKTKTTHYRETLAGFDPSAISSPEKLASLPVLRKSSLIQNPDPVSYTHLTLPTIYSV